MDISREEQIEKLRKEKMGLQLCSLALAGSFLLTGCGSSNDNNFDKNAGDEGFATLQYASDFEKWHAETKDVDTLVYIKGNTAILYEYDANARRTYVNAQCASYCIVLPEDDIARLPVTGSFVFPNHEMAEEFAWNLLGEDANVICMYYPEHTEANRKVLVP